ncbi:MAG TPA: 2Fe-2S iron-sulfur cluster-binding protein [Acidimicrobiales bacterium]|nr:2Fe-2S iron-sulfur cluster-binding protein [Acidimicrobiales bacterium]
MSLTLHVDGRPVAVPDDGSSLLEVLRDRLGVRSAKDGCSPQGQCGCCTVLVDGQPRVACVTPARRVAGRAITTFEGLAEPTRRRWTEAFAATGASQCGFCTPGILVRLAAANGGETLDEGTITRALLAHLCRCTGWRSIVDAATALPPGQPGRDFEAAERRASLEGHSPQRVGAAVAAGHAGFADDLAPDAALVAVPDGRAGWAVAESLSEARAAAGRVPGRRSGTALRHPLDLPPGDWEVTLRTTWVEPAYVESDASWCVPGGEPATPLANGGAFGAKVDSPAPAVARRLANQYHRPVRVLLSREDVVRLGPKRPPIAAGIRADGTGVVRVARTPGIAAAIRSAAPGLEVQEVDVVGPPTSVSLRAAGWAEGAILEAAAAVAGGRRRSVLPAAAGAGSENSRSAEVTVASSWGSQATAEVSVDAEGRPRGVRIRVACGDPLDEVVLRSYCIGAVHMALGWVCSEGLAVDDAGQPQDLTIRSFGILRAVDTPPIEVGIEANGGRAVNGSDAVFAATAAAAWIAQGLPPEWPTIRGIIASRNLAR